MKLFYIFSVWFSGVLVIITFFSFQPANNAHANTTEVTVSKLLASPDEYNLTTITLSGEVIGQPLLRDTGAWFHLLDDENIAIGIWTDKTTIDSIEYYGKYGIKGDVITLQGTFFKIHPDHGGDTCIELEAILLHEPGYTKSVQPVTGKKWMIAGLLGLFCLALWSMDRIKHKKNDG